MLDKDFFIMSDTSKNFQPLKSLGDPKLWQRAIEALAQVYAHVDTLVRGKPQFERLCRCFHDDVTETWTCRQVVQLLKTEPHISDQHLQRVCLSCLARRALQQGFAVQLQELAALARAKGQAL